MGDMGDTGPMGTTSPECYANNTAWLQTMAYCIQQNCNADGYPSDKQAECFSAQAVGGASTPTFHDSLPATPPTVELASDATWLNVTSLVNPDVYYSTHGTLGEFARQEYLHTKYSYALSSFLLPQQCPSFPSMRLTARNQQVGSLPRRHRHHHRIWPACTVCQPAPQALQTVAGIGLLVQATILRLFACSAGIPTARASSRTGGLPAR